MTDSMHILALSQPDLIRHLLGPVLCNGACEPRRDAFWRAWLSGETRR